MRGDQLFVEEGAIYIPKHTYRERKREHERQGGEGRENGRAGGAIYTYIRIYVYTYIYSRELLADVGGGPLQ